MNDKDDFWTLDRILPKKTVINRNPSRVDTVDVKVKSHGSSAGVDIRALFSAVNEKKGNNSLASAIEKESDYTHFTNSRIMNYAYSGFYNDALSYPNNARSLALSHFDRKPLADAQAVDYFSFKPSFSDLNLAQLEYYIYWRNEVYNGNIIKCSPSYAMLLVSEIINLPDLIPPEKGIGIIIDLWEKAFDDKTRYDRMLSDTVFEYCIIHDLPIPFERLRGVLNSSKAPVSQVLGLLYVIDHLLLKPTDFSSDDLAFIFENCLSYSFKQGKHYSENDKFREMLDLEYYSVLAKFFKAFPDCISKIFDDHEKRTSPIKIIKPAFLNINVSSDIKRNIVFEYYSFDKGDVEFQQLVNLAKHLENRFRSECGIRARLAVSALPPEFKSALDNAMSNVTTPDESKKDNKEAPLIQKKVEIDVGKAIQIEELSWDTTKMLTEGIEVFVPDPSEEDGIPENIDECSRLSEVELNVLRALIGNSLSEAEAVCRASGQFLDSVAASINEKLFDDFDDIVIDISTKCIFDEYISDVCEMFFKEKK